MKLRKSLLCLPLVGLLLTSCSGSSYYGVYGFAMGSQGQESRMSITLELTNTPYSVTIDSQTIQGEYFKIQLDAPEMGGIFGINTIEGCYSVDNDTVAKPRVHLNPVLNITEPSIDIPSEAIDMVMLAYYRGSSVDVVIPVSIEDLILQLYWYGVDLLGDDNPTEHELGTHPTSDDVTLINDGGYEDRHGSAFRDYYTLDMGLIKD